MKNMFSGLVMYMYDRWEELCKEKSFFIISCFQVFFYFFYNILLGGANKSDECVFLEYPSFAEMR